MDHSPSLPSGAAPGAGRIDHASAALRTANAAHERRYAEFLRTREAAGQQRADRAGLAARVAGAVGMTATATGFTTTGAIASTASLAALGTEVATRARASRAGEDSAEARRAYALGADRTTLSERLGSAIAATVARLRADPVPEPQTGIARPGPARPEASGELTAAPGRPRVPPSTDRQRTLAEALARTYVTVSIGGRTEFRFAGQPTETAFTVDGRRLTTTRPQPSVVRSMIDVAEGRGWRELRASGAPEFARAVWVEGTARGLRVAGYTPSEFDRQAAAVRTRQIEQGPSAANGIEAATQRTAPASSGTGTPRAEGRAPALRPASARAPERGPASPDTAPGPDRRSLRPPPASTAIPSGPARPDDPNRRLALGAFASALQADARLAERTRERILARAGEIYDRLATQGVTVTPPRPAPGRPVPEVAPATTRDTRPRVTPSRGTHEITR